MRLHVSGIGPGISTDDLCDKFSSAGRVLHVYKPLPRQLGGQIIHRDFAFIEFADEDREKVQRIVSALQGSVWKGQKVRFTEARPDYKARLLMEAESSEVDECDDGEAPDSENDAQQAEEPCCTAPSQETYRIRAPNGQVWALPCSGTGNKKSLFMPLRPLSMENWLCKELDSRRSSRYHINSIWQQMVEAQARRPPPDAELFSSAAVLPVPMVARGPHAGVPAAQPAATVQAAAVQPSEASKTMEIVSRCAALAAAAGGGGADTAVTFMDESRGSEAASQQQQAPLRGQRPDYDSSSGEDGEQGTAGIAAGQSAALDAQADAPLVALRAGKRVKKHVLDSDDGDDGLELDDGEKLSFHRLAEGVDMLGGFDGDMELPEVDLKRGTDALKRDLAEGSDGVGGEQEAQLLRTLLQGKGTDGAGWGAEQSVSREEEEEEEEGEQQEEGATTDAGDVAQLSSEEGRSVEEGAAAEPWGSSAADEEGGSGEDADEGGGDAVAEGSVLLSSSGDDGTSGDVRLSLEESDAWAAAFRLAAGRGGGGDSDMSGVEGDEEEEEGGDGDEDDEEEEEATAGAAGTQAGSHGRGDEQGAVATGRKRARAEGVAEAGVQPQSMGATRRANAAMNEAEHDTPKRSSKRGSRGGGVAQRSGASGAAAEQATSEEEAASADMMGDDMQAQVQALEREMMMLKKAAKCSSKPRRDSARQAARRQHQASAASKGDLDDEDEHQGGAVSNEKPSLAQIFREQRELAEQQQPLRDAGTPQQQRTAATAALFAQLPFHTPRSAQTAAAAADAEEVDTQGPARKEPDVELKTADYFIQKFAPARKPGMAFQEHAAQFRRTEDLAVLEGRLKASRPALLADMKSKLRMHQQRRQAEKELHAHTRKKKKGKTPKGQHPPVLCGSDQRTPEPHSPVLQPVGDPKAQTSNVWPCRPHALPPCHTLRTQLAGFERP